MMEEEWRDVKGYEGSYQVSDQGRVKSLARVVIKSGGKSLRLKERMMTGSPNNSNYLHVTLSKEGDQQSLGIHKIVAVAFIGHIPKGYIIVVDHINKNNRDNRPSNLRSVTQRANLSRRTLTSSIYTGVSWFERDKSWHSRIYHNGKNLYVGKFKSEFVAHLEYQLALKQITSWENTHTRTRFGMRQRSLS